MSEQGITQEDERWIEERRLAALEQRVGGIVETLWAEPDTETAEYRRRLAALRSPAPEVDGLREQVDRLAAFILAEVPGEPSQSQGAVDTAMRVLGQQMADLATARRERDEALGILRDWLDVSGHRDLTPVITRARALVAGKSVADPRDAEIERLRAKLAEAERCAQESADIMRRARDRAESYCLRLGEAESQRDALRAHAEKLDGLCERAADVALRVVAVGKSTPSLVLELDSIRDALRARGEVPR